MKTKVTQENIIYLIQQPGARLLATENGRVSGSSYRDEYLLEDGRYLQVTWDEACGDYPTAWAVTAKQQRDWIIER